MREARLAVNPYDTPRVVRAVIEDLIEYIRVTYFLSAVTNSVIAALQVVISSHLSGVYFRGTAFNKLVEMGPVYDRASNVLTFHFRPLSDDGRWLLRSMQLIPTSDNLPVPVRVANAPEVKRVVDL